jgi:hypothetical protein
MGGLGIAVADRRSFGLVNPATSAFVEQPTIHLSISPETRRSEDAGRRVWANSSDVPLLRGLILLPRGGRFSAALRQWNRAAFEVADEGAGDTLLPETRRIEGRGGFTALSLSLAARPLPWAGVGVMADLPFGSIRETWTRDFDDPLIDSRDELKTTAGPRPVWTIGGVASVRAATLGAFFRPAQKVDLDDEHTTAAGFVTKGTRSLRLPAETGVGATVSLRPGLLLGAEIAYAAWGSAEVDGVRPAGFMDVTRIGAGLEWVRDKSPRGRYFRRIPLRLGYYRQPWHFRDSDGNRIAEEFVSAGSGLPFIRDNGMIDAAIELGRRGDLGTNGLEEKIVRFTISVTYSRIDAREFPE